MTNNTKKNMTKTNNKKINDKTKIVRKNTSKSKKRNNMC